MSLTFEISRDDNAGGGFSIATLSSPGKPRSVVIGKVDVEGPAATAGMRQEHIGWHIIQVNGCDVDAETCASALDATRVPGQLFSLTVRSPRTGDLTVSSDLTARRHIDNRDLDNIAFHANPVQGSVRIEIPQYLLEAVGPQMMREVLLQNLQNLVTMRQDLDPAEKAALEEEELRAGENDVETLDESLRCVVCLSMKRAIQLLPCRHFATCHKCTVIVRRMGRCPLCREGIDDVKEAHELGPGDAPYIS